MKQLSLRPYNGRLFLARTVKEYEAGHVRLFKTPDVLSCAQCGRMTGGEGKNGVWTYLIWGAGTPQVAHEIGHVILHVFERCGIDPQAGNGEPFCYMLSQLLQDALAK